jgi:Icc protein
LYFVVSVAFENFMTLRIAQVSDIHIGPDDITYNGIDVRRNFLLALRDVIAWGPDVLVISGDLALDVGEPEAYKWIAAQIRDLPFPVIPMSGNHDAVERLVKSLQAEDFVQNEMMYFRRDLLGYPVFFLDSEPDSVDPLQLEWLMEGALDLDRPALLFMHHPPCYCDHQFMDRKYPLHNITEVQKVLKDLPVIKHVFCGHYHFAKQVQIPGGPLVHVCPATQMQISPDSKEFEVERYEPGWRSIEWDGQCLVTQVHYIPLH